MARRAPFPAGTAERLAVLMKQVSTKAPYQRLQCVWLAAQGQSAEQIAQALGWHPNSVRRVQHRFEREGEAALLGAPVGGRRHEYLTEAEEARLLEPLLAEAERGGVLVATAVKAVYEHAVGRRVPKSTIYRLLARHGWRKITPRPRHPKQAPAVQAAFKGGSRSTSPPSSPSRRRRGAGSA
jgi:transposase